MPGRKYQQGNSTYHYSINGQEKETELNENITTALYWEYDGRIVKRWNRDPIVKEWESPYAAFGNNPVLMIDPLGLDYYKDTKGKNKGDIVFMEGSGNHKGYKNITGKWTDRNKNGFSYLYGHNKGDITQSGPNDQLANVTVTATVKRSLIDRSSFGKSINESVKAYPAWKAGLDLYHSRLNSKQSVWQAGDGVSYAQNIASYQRYDQAEKDYRMMSYGAVGILGAPVAIVGAPELFAVSTELWGLKALLSIGAQGAFNGVENIDYADVVGDAFTAPGLNGLIGGGIDIRPFAADRKFQLVGYNKSVTRFAVDFSIGFGTGVVGDMKWSGLKPLLRTSTERSIFYMSTQSWIISANQGFNKKANDALDNK